MTQFLKGHGFESQCHILDGHFFTLICCKNCIVSLKRPKINVNEAGVGPFLVEKSTLKAISSQCNSNYDLGQTGNENADALTMTTLDTFLKFKKANSHSVR